MRVREAATRLDVSISTIYGLVAAGRIRHHRIGNGNGNGNGNGKGAIRIPEDAITEYLAAAEVVAKPPAPPEKRVFRHVRLP